MAHFLKPFFKQSRRQWYVEIHRRQICLGPDRIEAFRRYHELMRRPEVQPVNSASFAAIADAFLEWVEQHRAADTFEWYRYRLERFCRRFPDLRADELRPFHVQQWVDSYRHLSRTSKRNYLRTVKRCVKWAIAADELLDCRTVDGTLRFRLTDDVRRMAVQILGSKPISSTALNGVTAQSNNPAVLISPPATSLSPAETAKAISQPSRTNPIPPENSSAAQPQSLDDEPCRFKNFETFLVHFWLTGNEELSCDLIDSACEDIPDCPEVVEQGWSIKDAEVQFVATSLRKFVENEAISDQTAKDHADDTRQTLEHVDWRELAKSLLSSG